MADDEPIPRHDRSDAGVRDVGGSAGPPADVVDGGLSSAREYAALSAVFDPVEALRRIEGPWSTDATLLTTIAAELSRDCDTMTAPTGDGWLMRSTARRRVLDTIADAGRLDEAIRRRRDLPIDESTADLLDAVAGLGAFTTDAIAAALRDGDRATLERIAVGLGRADGHAARRADLSRVKSALIRVEMLSAARGSPGERVPARAAELEQILRWLDTGFVGYQPAALYVEGLPGTGKSTLVEEVAARLLERDDGWVVVRFDFERAGLDVQDTIGLSLEFARQVSGQVPGSSSLIQQARQHAASAQRAPQLKGDSPERVPEGLALSLRRALDAPAQRVLLVLDDLELLRRRGATHPARLFEWIEQLAELIQTQIAVVGAGPGDALDGIRARIGERIPLRGMDPAAADHELERLGVDRADWATVRAIGSGDPLSLRLAARLVRDHGTDAISQAHGREGMTPAYLYRALLSRVVDPDVRRIVGAAVIARRFDADAIRAFIGPASGLRDPDPARAHGLAEELARLDWLFETDPLAVPFIRSVPDVGRFVRSLLYDSAPAKSARVDRGAVRWFGDRREPWAATEAAYHRLQLMRRVPEPPSIAPSALARLDADSIAELPAKAQEFVRLGLGVPPEPLQDGRRSRGTSGSAAIRELRSLNGRSDWLEGDDLFERTIREMPIDPTSPDSDVVLTFLWRSGRWTEAGRALAGQGGWLRATPPLEAQLEQSRLDAICRLEMGAEFTFAAAVRAFRDHEDLRARVAGLASEPTLTSLLGAAVGFALHRADPTIEPLASTRRPGHDPLGAAIVRWGRRKEAGTEAALDAVRDGMQRIEDRTGPIEMEHADRTTIQVRAAAALTPFADLIETMSRLPDHHHLAAYAAAVQHRLNDLGNLAPLLSGPWPDRKASRTLAVHGLADLGLLAELAGAAAYLQRDPDLRLVAASAERWRRSVAGSWAYGPPPPAGWNRALDVTMTDRLAALLDSADPAAAAAAQLEAWAPEHPSAAEVLSLIRGRSPKTFGEAARTASVRGAGQAAAFLLRRSLPSAFVPPVAVLLATQDRRPPPPPPGRITPIAPSARPTTTTTAGAEGHPAARPDRRNANMTDERQDEERRRGDLRRRLADSPALREAVQRAATTGRLPDALVSPGSAEALDRGDELESVIQLDALEAIVRRVGRPPLVVRNDAVELEELPDFAPGTDALIKGVERSVLSVGRVEFVNHSMAWGGTGWVIGEENASTRIVATNRHVAKVVAQRGFDGAGVFLRSPTTGLRYGAEIDFKEEVASSPGDARPVEVVAITYLADDASPDVALLRIVGDDLPSPLPLADGEAEEEQLVAVIGYPAYDSRNDAADQAKYFRDLYEVKRFAPGFVMQALGGRKSLTHDCTSLGGNSGSPLISLHDGKVVGLHFAGRYGVENHAVGVGTLRRLLAGERPLAAGFEAARAEQQQIVEAASDGVHPPEFFGERAGYDPDFLEGGLAAPWPGTPAGVESGLARPSDEDPGRPFEVRYTHFGVKYHLARRQPLITAVNIDGEHPVRIKRTGDKWFRDARIPLEAQLTRRDYDDPEIDRGHMVRREDPNWDPAATGPTDVTQRAKLANDDTFHYTNSALQHSRMNQGKELWQGLENYILDSARTEGFRACVFTGPIFRADDPELAPGLPVPQEFWKLVVMPKAGGTELHATAYLLSQGELIRDLLEKRSRVEGLEGFVLGPYRTFQVAISDLAEGTGLDLAHYVEADPLRANAIGAEAIATGEPVFVPLDSLARIVV